jgi:hypothetical protein
MVSANEEPEQVLEMVATDDQSMHVAVVVKQYSISQRLLYRLMAAGKLPYFLARSSRRISVRAMNELLSTHLVDVTQKSSSN